MTLHRDGYSEGGISAKLRYSKSAVHNATVNFNTDGTFRDGKRSGRMETRHEALTNVLMQ